MPKSNTVKHLPLSKFARAAILLGFIANLIALVVTLHYYQITPKTAILIAPAIFMAVFIFVVLWIKLRYTLFEKYPYLLSLPSFIYRLGLVEKSPEVKGEIINRVFTVHSLSVLYIGIMDLILATSIATQNTSFLAPAIITLVAIFVVTVIALYRDIYRGFAAKK